MYDETRVLYEYTVQGNAFFVVFSRLFLFGATVHHDEARRARGLCFRD